MNISNEFNGRFIFADILVASTDWKQKREKVEQFSNVIHFILKTDWKMNTPNDIICKLC